jgi:cell fate regulator YaaT (PSP1 superfamily)
MDAPGSCFCGKGYGRHNCKLHTCDWLCNIPEEVAETTACLVEVQFKNTRKGYYMNEARLPLKIGDVVAVEALPGHDVGTVSMTGRLTLLQMRKNSVRYDPGSIKRIYRTAKQSDLDRYAEAKAREHETMIRARQIAARLGLEMKIGDVEYQGDGHKAIFYYIAADRVDFRELIKVLADAFHIRVEMKQIGSRQEAGRIGGIGPCGRELCCSAWMSNFVSVATDAARMQDISNNPQKQAGQCAKLKCCFNYEIDAYVEAQKQMPSRKITLETKDHTWYCFKIDVFRKEITYSTDRINAVNAVAISSARAFEVIAFNKKGVKPQSLLPEKPSDAAASPESHDILEDNVNRFDSPRKKRKKRPKKTGAQPSTQNENQHKSPETPTGTPVRKRRRRSRVKSVPKA